MHTAMPANPSSFHFSFPLFASFFLPTKLQNEDGDLRGERREVERVEGRETRDKTSLPSSGGELEEAIEDKVPVWRWRKAEEVVNFWWVKKNNNTQINK